MYVAKSISTLSCTAFYHNSSQSVSFVRLVFGSPQLFQQVSLAALQGFPANLLEAGNYNSLMSTLLA